MFSISTAWNSVLCANGFLIVDQIRELGLRRLELGFTLSREILKDILEEKNAGKIQIDSVHNFCPVPEGYDAFSFTPDYFSLAGTDEEQRKQAVALTLESMNTAGESGARVLILHAGRVEIESRTRDLISLCRQGRQNTPAYRKIFAAMVRERRKNRRPYLDAVTRSLEELLPQAKARNIILCLENRFYHREIPFLDEFGMLFEHFGNDRNLRYWHDVGHALVNETLGFCAQREYLERYAGVMAGIHLHDVRGMQDHRAPLQGNFGFEALKPYVNNQTLKVIEVHQPATPAQIVQAVKYLEKIFA